MTLEEIKALDSQHVIHTYNRKDLAFKKGKGMILTDVNGKEYKDFLAGIAVVTSSGRSSGSEPPLASKVTVWCHLYVLTVAVVSFPALSVATTVYSAPASLLPPSGAGRR